MFYLYDCYSRIILGTSPKAGRTFVLNIYRYIKEIDSKESVYKSKDLSLKNIYKNEKKFSKLFWLLKEFPNSIKSNHYSKNFLNKSKLIIFIRNPYDRLVSGFMDKYNYYKNPTYPKYYSWNCKKKLTFRNFVNELEKNNVDKNHFENQINHSDIEYILNNQNLTVFDIGNIDYPLLSTFFNKEIPDKVINFKTNHQREKSIINIKNKDKNKVCDLTHDLIDMSAPWEQFYDDDILNKVNYIYSNDFKIFSDLGFFYKVSKI